MFEIEKSNEVEGKNRKKIREIAFRIVSEHVKGKLPLFVIGSGISMDLKNNFGSKTNKMRIPSMCEMINKLYYLYNESNKNTIPENDREELEKHFETFIQQLNLNKKIDRGNIAGILGYFQEKGYLKEVWITFIQWLLEKCVDEDNNIGIRNAQPSSAHERIAELYSKVNAFCVTINFDGIFYKALKSKYGNKGDRTVFSYYTKKDAENFFITENMEKEKKVYVDIQIRGDIFFVICDPIWCDDYELCPHKIVKPVRIWESNLKCEEGKYRKPYISFPGAYEKDREVREILEVLWEYLANNVSCIITIGIAGWWDPILTAFLADLSRERNIPFIDVNTSPEDSYIAKEIVNSDSSLTISANQFMKKLSKYIEENIKSIQTKPKVSIRYSKDNSSRDEFWDNILENLKWDMTYKISDFEEKLLKNKLVKITDKFGQLGLKSKWWGISKNDRWNHNRLNHSKGVMKIATFLYEKACKNSGRPERDEEKQFLRIAALLHDIGHLPFSHLIEEVIQELNWRPVGYIKSFTHNCYTEEKIRKIFADKNLEQELDNIKYSVDDLINLINGKFGVGFIDAIIDGPIDADKIDYVFRDAEVIKFGSNVNPTEFLKDFGKEISISPRGLLVIKGISTQAAFSILEQREKLYNDFYLTSSIRLFEKAVRFIILTYFVHNYNTLKTSAEIERIFLNDRIQFSDLGAMRIAMVSEALEALADDYKGKDDIEMEMINHMKNNLMAKNINERAKKAIEKCFSLISKVNSRNRCITEEKEMRMDSSMPKYAQERANKIRRIIKTVTLRFPGAVLIDFLPPFEFYKITMARKQKPRSDGTNVSSKCILNSDLMEKAKNHTKGRIKNNEIFIYKTGEESEANNALNLFKRLLIEEELSEEEE